MAKNVGWGRGEVTHSSSWLESTMEAQRREDQNTRFRYQVLLGQTPSYLTATEVSDVNML